MNMTKKQGIRHHRTETGIGLAEMINRVMRLRKSDKMKEEQRIGDPYILFHFVICIGVFNLLGYKVRVG